MGRSRWEKSEGTLALRAAVLTLVSPTRSGEGMKRVGKGLPNCQHRSGNKVFRTKHSFKEEGKPRWRDGSATKSICSSHRNPRCGSQHPQGAWHPSPIPVSGNSKEALIWTPKLPSTQAKYSHPKTKNKSNLKKKNLSKTYFFWAVGC